MTHPGPVTTLTVERMTLVHQALARLGGQLRAAGFVAASDKIYGAAVAVAESSITVADSIVAYMDAAMADEAPGT